MVPIGVATGLLGVASNPNGNPSQYYTGVASNPNIGMLATPLAVPASPWQPQRENASYASGDTNPYSSKQKVFESYFVTFLGFVYPHNIL